MRLSTNNIIYIAIIFLVYLIIDNYLVANYLFTASEILIIQGSILLIALSPVGEWILRLIYGSRQIKTNREKARLVGIYEEVYEMVRYKYPNVNRNINLYIDKSMDVNAYAIGRRSITVTQGALNTLDDDQLKGVLAHEFGHIVHGDTIIPLLLLVGNALFLLFMLMVKIFHIQLYIVTHLFNRNLGIIINFLFKLALGLVIAIGGFVVTALLMINRRGNEYSADEFAEGLGLERELLSALYLINDIDLSEGKPSLIDRIKASHPDLEDRIERLERSMPISRY